MYSDYKTPLLEQCKSLSHISEDLKLSIQKYQYDVNIWVDYRLNVIYALKNDCAQLEVCRKQSLLSRIAGSLIGLASGGAMILGALISPPLMVGALIVSVATGVSNSVALAVNWQNQKKKIRKLQEYVEKDGQLLRKVVESHKIVSDMFEKAVKDEYFRGCLRNEQELSQEMLDFCNLSFDENGCKVTTIIVAYGLHSIVFVGTIIDLVTFVKCLMKLRTKSKPVEGVRNVIYSLENGFGTIVSTVDEVKMSRAYENENVDKTKEIY